MNYLRLALAALGGTVASFAVGFLVLWLAPALFEEARKYPAVFRREEEMMAVMPFAMIATLVGSFVVAMLFAMIYRDGSHVTIGARLGILMGILAVCNVLHNYVNFNIGMKLAVGQAAAYLVQWTVVGIVVSLIYRPSATP